MRLACVRHAASVDSEPGSNSRLKPVAGTLRRRPDKSRLCPRLKRRHLTYENNQAKPDFFSRLARSTICQRSLRTYRLGGALLDRGPDCVARIVLELVAPALTAFSDSLNRFCANLLNLSNFHLPVKPGRSHRLRPLDHNIGGRSSQPAPACPERRSPSQKHRAAQNFQISTGSMCPSH